MDWLVLCDLTNCSCILLCSSDFGSLIGDLILNIGIWDLLKTCPGFHMYIQEIPKLETVTCMNKLFPTGTLIFQ